MSQFNFADYQNVVARASGNSNTNSNKDSVKIGYFKLADDGDSALVRINCDSVTDLKFASVHGLGKEAHWIRVSCLNAVGSYSDDCPFCKAAKEYEAAAAQAKAEGRKAPEAPVGKASKRVYVEMMCSYIDKATGQPSEAIPVIWDRPAGFANEVVALLNDYKSLKNCVLKITRNGVKGDMKTTYSLNFIPTYQGENFVKNDFSAFENFNIAKHSYWEKTAEEMETFLATGAFPEIAKKSEAPAKSAYTTPAPTAAPVNPTPYVAPVASAAPVADPTPTPAPAAPTPAPAPAPAPTTGSLVGGFKW